jgi:hypothetical protein
LDEQGCCLMADLKPSMENEGPDRNGFGGRTRLGRRALVRCGLVEQALEGGNVERE